MTQHDGNAQIQRGLRVEDGAGVVRLEVRLPTDVDDVWSALTDPQRIAGWLGEVDGDLRDRELHGHWFASGWQGTLRVEVCEPSRRLVVTTKSEDGAGVVELTLAAESARTLLVVEDHGMPLADIAAYGAGDQIHVEDLAGYLDGRGRCDARARFQQLLPGWQGLAEDLSQAG